MILGSVENPERRRRKLGKQFPLGLERSANKLAFWIRIDQTARIDFAHLFQFNFSAPFPLLLLSACYNLD